MYTVLTNDRKTLGPFDTLEDARNRAVESLVPWMQEGDRSRCYQAGPRPGGGAPWMVEVVVVGDGAAGIWKQD